MPRPTVSVVIPTFNRKEMLKEMIGLLEEQTIPSDEFEVVVVDDGGSDDTPTYLGAVQTSFRLRVISQQNSGAAVARNTGAREATGQMIVFMDDDLVPLPGMIESHRNALADDEKSVVLGKLMPWKTGSRGAWNKWEDRIYSKHYAAVEANRRPPSGRRLYSGNFSIWREQFLAAGGFNADLLRGEDVELGFRLESMGAVFKFSAGASAYHRGYRSYASWRNSSYLYGVTDVQLALARRHKQALDEITTWYRGKSLPIRILIKTGLNGGRIVRNSMEVGLRWLGTVTDKLRMSRLSHLSFTLIYGLNYWQGAADEIGGRQALMKCVYGSSEYRAALIARMTNGQGPVEGRSI